jgi:hypothetical protein
VKIITIEVPIGYSIQMETYSTQGEETINLTLKERDTITPMKRNGNKDLNNTKKKTIKNKL